MKSIRLRSNKTFSFAFFDLHLDLGFANVIVNAVAPHLFSHSTASMEETSLPAPLSSRLSLLLANDGRCSHCPFSSLDFVQMVRHVSQEHLGGRARHTCGLCWQMFGHEESKNEHLIFFYFAFVKGNFGKAHVKYFVRDIEEEVVEAAQKHVECAGRSSSGKSSKGERVRANKSEEKVKKDTRGN